MATDGDLRRLDVNYIAALALHSHRRDLALYRAGYISRKTRGLLWYYSRLRSEIVKDFFKAAFDVGVTTAARQRMAEILTEAENARLERKRELLEEAEQLQVRLQQLTGSAQ